MGEAQVQKYAVGDTVYIRKDAAVVVEVHKESSFYGMDYTHYEYTVRFDDGRTARFGQVTLDSGKPARIYCECGA